MIAQDVTRLGLVDEFVRAVERRHGLEHVLPVPVSPPYSEAYVRCDCSPDLWTMSITERAGKLAGSCCRCGKAWGANA